MYGKTGRVVIYKTVKGCRWSPAWQWILGFCGLKEYTYRKVQCSTVLIVHCTTVGSRLDLNFLLRKV